MLYRRIITHPVSFVVNSQVTPWRRGKRGTRVSADPVLTMQSKNSAGEQGKIVRPEETLNEIPVRITTRIREEQNYVRGSRVKGEAVL